MLAIPGSCGDDFISSGRLTTPQVVDHFYGASRSYSEARALLAGHGQVMIAPRTMGAPPGGDPCPNRALLG